MSNLSVYLEDGLQVLIAMFKASLGDFNFDALRSAGSRFQHSLLPWSLLLFRYYLANKSVLGIVYRSVDNCDAKHADCHDG